MLSSPTRGFLIDGEVVPGRRFEAIVDPATEQPFDMAPVAGREEFQRAVTAACTAAPGWAAAGWATRRAALLRFAESLEEHAHELSFLQTREQGRPRHTAEAEIAGTAGFVRTIAGVDWPVRTIAEDAGRLVRMHYRPLGVVAAIAPWNGPISLAAVKIANALLAGNTLILKPSPFTPLTTLELAGRIRSLFPRGVLNVLGGGAELGEWMTTDPRIAKVSFTGSTATGKRIAAAAAPTLKRMTLELGGNDAAIILEDADLEHAAEGICAKAFANCGQFCAGVKRAYVHEAVTERFVEALVRHARAIRVGEGLDPQSMMGPLQNRMQFEKVLAMLEEARAAGARVMTGGIRMNRPGYFLPPTVVVDALEGMRLVDEEQFGPVLPVLRYQSVDEAIRRANDGPYGLGGSIWTSDTARGEQLALRLDVGTSWINQHGALHSGIPLPFARESGIGIDYGPDGVLEFMQRHVVNAKR